MSIGTLRIERIPTGASDDALELCRRIRQEVFVVEQQVPSGLEWDGLDADSEHFVAFMTSTNDAATPVGTARLRIFPEFAKAERVAVLASGRRRGVGLELMRALEVRAEVLGAVQVRLNAQIVAESFYKSLGYERVGAPFEEAGIPHIAMRKPSRHGPPLGI